MRALFLRQQEKFKEQWYRARGETAPNLGLLDEPPEKTEHLPPTITRTSIIDGYRSETAGDNHLDQSYWETDNAGMEPIEFLTSLNTMKSDSVISWTVVARPGCGAVNRCFTPYENDVMSFGAFETMRLELRRRGQHLANEMERVDNEFHRPPKKNWFCLKKSDFSVEHFRFNEIRRRNASKWAFRD
jgi:hypothetical protein